MIQGWRDQFNSCQHQLKRIRTSYNNLYVDHIAVLSNHAHVCVGLSIDNKQLSNFSLPHHACNSAKSRIEEVGELYALYLSLFLPLPLANFPSPPPPMA